MKLNIIKSITASFFIICVALIFNHFIYADSTLASYLKGRILLQVEGLGEAWYVNPVNLERYYLGRPDDAFKIMRELGQGITNNELSKISIAEANMAGVDDDNDGLSNKFEEAVGTLFNDPDTDADGYNDKTEILNGYNPKGKEKLNIDNSFAKRIAGNIYIQVEAKGEAWYINPVNLKRYYLGSPTDAFNVMRILGLGISNINLAQIIENQPAANNNDKTPIEGDYSLKNYLNTNGNFSLQYPSGWMIKKYPDAPGSVMFTDSDKDYFLEKKAVIIITYVKKNKETGLENFNIAAKTDANKIADDEEEINNLKALKQEFAYAKTYEYQIVLEKNSKEFLFLTLVTANGSNSSYKNKFDDMVKSVKFK